MNCERCNAARAIQTNPIPPHVYQVFASGYVALIRRTCDKKLAVVATGDADNPLRYVRMIYRCLG